jgi:hypothetical protein
VRPCAPASLNLIVRCHKVSAVPTFSEEFQALRERYFDPLCVRLGLGAKRSTQAASSGFAVISAAAASVRVHFESDRGLCSFSVGFADDERDLCSVETLAERFPRIRLLSEGQQRLSLEEQVSFLCDHWTVLQVMFSPSHAGETRAWRTAQAKAYMQKFARDT